MQFEVELAFERVVERFDQLADGFEQVLGQVRGAVAVVGRSNWTPRSARNASSSRKM
ncbi:hypothetical protein AB0F52_26185 [Amycolatopsis sp. NPDC024027]|uniref:hypothetical protein n=1 Tax=Amycolatopsis sp. NPDC024027 TaxID=3154327 RepID=UPI0034001F47